MPESIPHKLTKAEIKLTAALILQQDGELEAARYLAETLFADKVDKAGKPYIGHLNRVSAGAPDNLKAAGFLHDLVEDVEGWTYQDLLEVGFSAFTVGSVRAVTKLSEGEPYFDAIVRVGLTPSAIPLKRSDLKDNSNLLRLDHIPGPADFERVKKYFLADKYLEDIELGRIPPGADFKEWMATKPESMQDRALVEKETARGAKPPAAPGPAN